MNKLKRHRFLKYIVVVTIMLLVAVVCAELFFQACCTDVVHLRPRRECINNLLLCRHECDLSCPLGNGVVGYERFPGITENAPQETRFFVFAADKALFHSERISLLVAPLRFAMVLLNTGDVVEWVGRDRDYADALRQAKNSVDGCDIEQFFAKSTRKINPKFDLRMRWRKQEEGSE